MLVQTWFGASTEGLTGLFSVLVGFQDCPLITIEAGIRLLT